MADVGEARVTGAGHAVAALGFMLANLEGGGAAEVGDKVPTGPPCAARRVPAHRRCQSSFEQQAARAVLQQLWQ